MTELTYFLSASTKNRDLSSFETKYGFLGGVGGEVPTELRGTTLETWFIGKWFRSRECFFQAMKAAAAATGTHKAANEALAASILTMTPRGAKQAGKLPNKKNPSWGGQLEGRAKRAAVGCLANGGHGLGCEAAGGGLRGIRRAAAIDRRCVASGGNIGRLLGDRHERGGGGSSAAAESPYGLWQKPSRRRAHARALAAAGGAWRWLRTARRRRLKSALPR